MSTPLLSIQNLTLSLGLRDKAVDALCDVSLDVASGEILGIVGESGCGKSLTALAIMRLMAPNASIREGSISFQGQNLLTKSTREMRAIRGNDISMIFQEPMTSLNPVFTIGNQLVETIRLHQPVTRAEARVIAIKALSDVGIPAPEMRLSQYPHNLSGGMRQRVMIAMALACQPGLLIADEPTTALDVTIQAQILNIIKRLRDERGLGVMLITHDLGVVAKMCDRVMVMYAGQVAEQGTLEKLFRNPFHPYTKGLMASIPRLDGTIPEELPTIAGRVPSLASMPEGCRFHPRCEHAMDVCREKRPLLTKTQDGHHVACWLMNGQDG